MVAEAYEYQYNADAFEARGGADMKVEIYNDGPVTIILDSHELFKK